MVRKNNRKAGVASKSGFLGKPTRVRYPDDNEPIDDEWLRAEGYLVRPGEQAVVSLDDGGTEWGGVLIRTDKGWLFETSSPPHDSVMLVPQPITRGYLRKVITMLIACYCNRGPLDIFDALHIGFTTHGDSSPSI